MVSQRPDIKLTPEEQARFLAESKRCALATLDKDGYPHVVAMNYVAKDGAIWMTSYGKAQKVLNIRRNPKVCVMIESGRNYAELQGLMWRGRCEIIDEPSAVQQTMRAMAGSVAAASNVPSGASSSVPSGASSSAPKRVVLKVTPEKIASWDHRKLGGRY